MSGVRIKVLLWVSLAVIQVPQARGVDCMPEINKCETSFLDGVTAAGSNVALACAVGATLETCLKQREYDSNCAPHQTDIDNIRNSYALQIDQVGCSSTLNVACMVGIEDCINSKNNPNLNEGDMCSRDQHFVKCLQSLTCPKAYQYKISQNIDFIRLKDQTAGCSGSEHPFGNGASMTTMSALSLVGGLTMAAYFRL